MRASRALSSPFDRLLHDRRTGVLRVAAVHVDAPFGAAMRAAVAHEIRDLARWLDLELELPG